jgi:hypothetical protein
MVQHYNQPLAAKSIIGCRPITWKLGFGELPIAGGNPTRSYLANRAVGLPISNVMAQALIRGHLQTFAPEVLKNPRFKCSNTFVKRFLHDELRWSHRVVTRAAQKTPHQYSYNFLVGTCTGLYKPVQALKVESLQEKQAMSDFPQV